MTSSLRGIADPIDKKEFIVLLPTLLAYIDPVSGAILLQVIVAGIVGCVAFFRRSIWRILRFVFRLKSSDEDTTN